MAEAAVTFLLEQLKEVVVGYADLIAGAENEFYKLSHDLDLLKAFLKKMAEKKKKDKTLKSLEMRIRDVVYEVEDTIDTCLTKAIEAKARNSLRRRIGIKSVSLAKEVRAIRDEKVVPLFEDTGKFANMEEIAHGAGARAGEEPPTHSSKRDTPIRQNKVVGFEKEESTITGYLKEKTDKLDVISIMGIPGQGKTTLAWKIYQSDEISFHFPIRIWVNISQVFNSRDVFLGILKRFFPSQDMSTLNFNDLAQTVHACLEKEKFLLVLDDVWSVVAWNEIKEVLPVDNGEAKVLITTRETDVGEKSRVHKAPHSLKFLDGDESWELLQYEVFGLEDCPPELSTIGYLIATRCDGVPLTIVVIGGILKDQLTKSRSAAVSEWELTAKSVSEALQNKAKRITEVVELSYDRLPDDLRDTGKFANMEKIAHGAGDGAGEEPPSSKRDIPIRQNRVVGFDKEEATITGYLKERRDKLDVISIVGIPGQGKTTLAWKIYENEPICFHFPIRIWVYISQVFNSRDVFLQILKKFIPSQDISSLNDDELAQTVRACLEKEKFLLVLDDVWSVDAWEKIQAVLPLHNGEGKVLITSRETNVGVQSQVYRPPHTLKFLDDDESWELLQYEVFGDLNVCPTNLEGIGEQIAMKCDGVPLTIVVIGGILKDQLTKSRFAAVSEWKLTAKSVSEALQNKAKRITEVVELSYDRLPDDLRECFVFLGVFPEDYEIPAKMLCGLWISEGFVLQRKGRSIEESAEENMDDLISRNLLKVEKTNHMGKVKTCRVHDMIRTFCISISEEENLCQEVKRSAKTGELEPSVSQLQESHRLCFRSDLSKFLSENPSGPHVRSFMCFYERPVELESEHIAVIPDGFKKLRILESKCIKLDQFPSKVTKLVHLRYLTLYIETLKILPEPITQLWNLQSLVVETKSRSITMKANMWRMVRLRYLKTRAAILLDSSKWEGDAGQNLHTLNRLAPESCTDAVSRKAKNLKTLGISGKLAIVFENNFLEKLLHLEKLKLVNVLTYEPTSEDMLHCLPHPGCFPPNLKRLTLTNTFLGWKQMSALAKIGTLEVLKLKENAFVGVYWTAADVCFPLLQVLIIEDTDLVIWEASSESFPSLKCLVLKKCENLSEIPDAVAETLEKLEIDRVRESTVVSARKIFEAKKRAQVQEVPFNGQTFCTTFKLKDTPIGQNRDVGFEDEEETIKMGEAAVSFLLEQVKEVVTEYKDLISGAENEFYQLIKELGLLKAFLKDAAKATKQEHLFREMEKQVREVVYEIEDTIDTCLTKAIEARAKKAKPKKSSFSFSKLRSSRSFSLLREVKSIREEKVLPMFNYARMKFSTMEIGDGSGAVDDQRTKLKRDKPIRQNRVVGFEDEEETIKGYLMPETETAQLDVIPIIGIPGQGKTTLAWKIYQNESICYNFPIRIWVYISQKFNIRDVFLQILRKFTTSQYTSNLNDDELAQTVKVCLEKEKFLLVLDDVWSVDAWKGIKEVLPLDNGKGKVLITSREEAVGEATSVYRRAHKLRFLTKEESWTLLQYEVFSSLDECPDELSAIGEHIAIKCDGVPLTIVVIGGILVDQLARGVAMEGWEEVSKNVSDALQKDEAQRITSVVALSYDRLPDDLRDCFVYLGVFPEDYEIPVRVVCGLWIAEGFIQPKDGRNLEETAQDNLNDLIRRNLVKVDKTNPMGKVKTFRVHDMIRAFCITISKKESLFHEIKKFRTGVSQLDEVEKAHRLCFHSDLSNFLSEGPKGPHVRSLLCFYEQPVELNPEHITVILDGFPKLRILESKSVKFHQFPAKVTKLIHLRYLTLSIDNLTILPEQIYQLWNLQTLIVETKKRSITMKANVWQMIRLRHFKTKAAIVLDNNWEGEAGQNLQTLERLSPESCTEAASRRAKNLKTLGISGKLVNIFGAKFLEKLYHLEKLKLVNSIPYEPTSEDMLHRLPLPNCFPPNLKRLTLSNTFLGWHHMSMLAMINSLEVLKLKDNAFAGVAWKVVGYTFPSLQLLHIVNADLLIWEASPDAFPCLKYLVVKNCENLNKIPESLGKRLQKLEVERLRDSAIESAREIGNSKKGGQKGKFAVDFDLKEGPVSETSKATSN